MAVTKQTNIVANRARNLVFFEEEELCYNYKTDQWSIIPAWDGLGMYSVNSQDSDIGLVRYSAGSVDLQDQLTSYVEQDATLTTGERDINQGGRALVTGVRPIVSGADGKIAIIYRDTQNPSTRTNAIEESEDITTWWADQGITATADATTDPNGGSTADQMTETASGNAERYINQTVSHNAGNVDIVVSCFAKSDGTVDHVGLYASQTTHGSDTDSGAWFDLANAIIDSDFTGVDVPKTLGMTDAGNGWYRCWMVVSTSGLSTNLRFYQSTSPNVSYFGSGSDGIYIWGIMAEEADHVGGYIKSDGSNGTATNHTTLKRSPNSRSGMANFRVEARYHKLEWTRSGGFTTAMGADVEFTPTGRV